MFFIENSRKIFKELYGYVKGITLHCKAYEEGENTSSLQVYSSSYSLFTFSILLQHPVAALWRTGIHQQLLNRSQYAESEQRATAISEDRSRGCLQDEAESISTTETGTIIVKPTEVLWNQDLYLPHLFGTFSLHKPNSACTQYFGDQIGRAGRYGSKFAVGEVTCLDAEELPLLHSSLELPSPDLECAGLFPTFDLLSLYSRLQSTNKFYPMLEQFLEKAKLSPDYFIADCEHILKVAVIVDELPLGLHEKYTFCISPVDMDDDISAQGLIQFAENYAKKGLVRLREIFTPGTLEVPKSQRALKELESVHKVLDLYVWLSFRMEESFPDRELASSQKAICSLLIEDFLERLGWFKRGKASYNRMPLNLQKYHSTLVCENAQIDEQS